MKKAVGVKKWKQMAIADDDAFEKNNKLKPWVIVSVLFIASFLFLKATDFIHYYSYHNESIARFKSLIGEAVLSDCNSAAFIISILLIIVLLIITLVVRKEFKKRENKRYWVLLIVDIALSIYIVINILYYILSHLL